MKNLNSYNPTYDKNLSSMLNSFLSYTCSTTDTQEEQEALATKVISILKENFTNFIGNEENSFNRQKAMKEIKVAVKLAHGRIFIDIRTIHQFGNHIITELHNETVCFAVIDKHSYSLKYNYLSDDLLKKILEFIRKSR